MTDLTPAILSEALCDAADAGGGHLRWPQACRQFDTPADLDVFRRDLAARGLLSSEALEAVRERQRQLGRGRA